MKTNVVEVVRAVPPQEEIPTPNLRWLHGADGLRHLQQKWLIGGRAEWRRVSIVRWDETADE
jgi:hypothetical protein